jgi:hypothetical protein
MGLSVIYTYHTDGSGKIKSVIVVCSFRMGSSMSTLDPRHDIVIVSCLLNRHLQELGVEMWLMPFASL